MHLLRKITTFYIFSYLYSQSSTALFLKSNFEFLRQNYRKAIKLLNSAPQTSDFRQTGESIPVFYFNNLACIHFYMNKFHLGAYYARKALQENQNALSELPNKKQGKGKLLDLKVLAMISYFKFHFFPHLLIFFFIFRDP